MEHLIPPYWFDGLAWPWLLLIAAAAITVLVRGADWLVSGAAGLARRLGMPKVVVGATVISLGTTSPEAAVSVMAAWQGDAGLALGNAAGSVIADTGLIFGLGCLLVKLPADAFVLRRQGWVQFGVGVLLAALCYLTWWVEGDDATLGRWVGILLVALLVLYMYFSVRWGKAHPEGEPFVQEAEQTNAQGVLWNFGKALLGLALVVLASHVLILSVRELAMQWGVPKAVVAATIVALGTSLPELAVGVASIRKGHPELLVGNVIGADILNVLFVVGASAVAHPLKILEPGTSAPAIFLYVHLPTMLGVLVLMRLYIFASLRRGHFVRWYGVPLLTLYLFYGVVQYGVSL